MKCQRCGREGTRGYDVGSDGLGVCTARSACNKRIQDIENSQGVYRWESGSNHFYKLDGKRVPGVTTLTKEGLPRPALVGWGIKSVARYAAQHLEELWAMRGMGEEAVFEALRQAPYTQRNDAGARGTVLHKYAERLMRDEDVEVPPELRPWVMSIVDYLDDHGPKQVLQETAVGSRRWQYCGTLDDVSDFPDGKRRVVDYKSGRGVYEDDALQLAAYRWAEVYKLRGVEMNLSDLGMCDEGYIIHVRPEGYEVVPFYIGPEVHQAFLRVAWVARDLRGLRRGEGQLDEWMGQPLPRPERERSA